MANKNFKGRKPGLTKVVVKEKIICIRISPKQDDYINQIIAAINEKSAAPVTRTWVLLTMVELGRAALEKKFNIQIKPMVASKPLKA